MSDQYPGGSGDHFPVWTQGDATDVRAQFLQQLKLDDGVPFSDGLAIVVHGKTFVVGRVTSAGIVDGSIATGELADGAVTLIKMAPNSVDSSKIVDGSIVNADVNAAAAIAYTKLNLANSIVTGDIANGTILDADINAAAGINLSKLEAGATALAAPMTLGMALGDTGQLDMATMATAITAYGGGSLPADMGSDARTLQVRLVSGFRVSAWGTCTGISGSVTWNRISNGASSGVITVRTNNHNMNPGSHPAPYQQMVDSGWANVGSEAAQSWNFNSTFNFTVARPTGQVWAQAFLQGV